MRRHFDQFPRVLSFARTPNRSVVIRVGFWAMGLVFLGFEISVTRLFLDQKTAIRVKMHLPEVVYKPFKPLPRIAATPSH